jgi:acetyl-CoA C-acetyltransferase
MEKVYIIAAKRTAVGKFLGALSDITPGVLAATVAKQLIKDTDINIKKIDEVIVGNVLSAGQKQCVGRQVAIHSGLPVEVSGYSINMVCGSGMKAVMNGFSSIKSGENNIILAGGTENMSQAPFLQSGQTRKGFKMGDLTLKDHILVDALTDAYTGIHMGNTAENIAEKYNISREIQDEFAISSQKKAIYAIDSGKFKDEIVPIEINVGKETIIFDTDEHPNRKTNLEKLSTLKTAFKKDGTVTPGNSSGLNDGAAMLLLVSEKALKENNLIPLAEIVSCGQGGVDPNFMGLGPVVAMTKALTKANLLLKDMDLIELNEAFAAQSIGVIKELSQLHNLEIENIMAKTNLNGGAISLGHAVGGSGARILVTLLHEMKKKESTYGIASLCIGGGMGTAIILKNCQ